MGQVGPRRNICFGSGTKHEWVEGGETGLQERKGQPITEESEEDRRGKRRGWKQRGIKRREKKNTKGK